MDVTTALTAKATRFRDMHLRGQILILPNPWDPGTARLIEHLGFEAMATTSAGFAHSRGLPDGGVGKEAALAHAAEIAASTSLPVSADLENCFSPDPDGVGATVAAAIETGIVGCSVEDATGIQSRPIYNFDLAVERVAAAVAVAQQADFPFTLTARAEGFLYGQTDLNEIIARLQAFEAVGADVVYAPGIKDIGEIATIVAAVSVPVNVLAQPEFTVHALEEIGVARVSVGSGLARTAFGAFYTGAQELIENGMFGYGLPGRPDLDLNGIFSGNAD